MVVTARGPEEEVCFSSLALFATCLSTVESASTNSTMLQGASPRELLLESARRNNTDLLLEEVIKDASDLAGLLNSTRDGVGNTAIHLAAKNGSRASPLHPLPPIAPPGG